MVGLENMLDNAFAENEVRMEDRPKIMGVLDALREKDRSTYEHSIRVGLLAARIANFLHIDSRALLYAGLLHDAGKLDVRTELLQKKTFSEEDHREMQPHVINTHARLSQLGFHYSADLAVGHHTHQERPYPSELPPLLHPYSISAKALMNYQRAALALADFYDAISTRENDKFGGASRLTEEQIKQIMQQKRPDAKQLIEELFDNGIFSKNIKPLTDVQTKRMEEAMNQIPLIRTPQEIRRMVSMAIALEPLYDKRHCTTRTTDCSSHLKLEYFVAGGINAGDAFEALASRLISANRGKQPEIYDFAYQAQLDCKKNRGGGRINQGMLEMLIPIVAAQSLFDPKYTLSTEEVLSEATNVLKNSSPNDVVNLIRMKQLANDLCAYDREVPKHGGVKNIFDYYAADLLASKTETGRMHNGEFVEGFPAIRAIYHRLADKSTEDLRERVRCAYLEARKGIHKETSVGLTADCIGAGIYLLLSQNPKSIIIN